MPATPRPLLTSSWGTLQRTTEPGFASELDEGLGIGAGDQITYNVLGDLLYWNDGFKPVPNFAQIRIVNQPPSPLVPDTILGVATGMQPGSYDPAMNRIGAASMNGDFHSDLDFFLEPKDITADASMFGAYGFMMSLSTDATGIDDSDPFATVFNFGLEEEHFEELVVLDSAGRLQVPKVYREALEIQDRVRMELGEDNIVIRPVSEAERKQINQSLVTTMVDDTPESTGVRAWLRKVLRRL